MERPQYEERIARQNHLYATDVLEKFRDRPKSAGVVLDAIFESFILGAGGYEGSFDAAMVLEDGGLAVLLSHLGLIDIDANPTAEISNDRFEEAIRATVDYGASYDLLEEEIPELALGDGDILQTPFGAYTSRMNMRQADGTAATPDWRTE